MILRHSIVKKIVTWVQKQGCENYLYNDWRYHLKSPSIFIVAFVVWYDTTTVDVTNRDKSKNMETQIWKLKGHNIIMLTKIETI